MIATNAFKQAVVGTYTAAATVIELNSISDTVGNADYLPNGGFNLILYDGLFGNPADANNGGDYEILECSSVNYATNEITVVRARENTTAVTIDASSWQVVYGATVAFFAQFEDADATILKEADVVDTLVSTSIIAPLSANQGKQLQDTKIPTADIINDLTTGGATKVLSAEQGVTLEDTKVGKNITATGGTITTVNGNKIHTFLSSSNFDITAGKGMVEYLIIAGGGGGGGGLSGAGQGAGAGAGAGGVIHGFRYIGTGTYTVTIGNGGAGGAINSDGSKGSNSVFDNLTAEGGGYGASAITTIRSGGTGGSGGGSSGGAGTLGDAIIDGASGIEGQGNKGGGYFGVGYRGGGGGGGSLMIGWGSGRDVGRLKNLMTGNGGGHGGDGIISDISGSLLRYAGGGGGGTNSSFPGKGGLGGGGQGSSESPVQSATAGTANTGGGGGAGRSNEAGGAGGSGIVILRYIE